MENPFKRLWNFLTNPDKRFLALAHRGFYDNMDDETYLRKMFKGRVGYEPNLDNPRSFNEKLQWLKLHDRNPVYTVMVDKIEAKKYVANIIGEEYIIPTIAVWDSVESIDFDSLPNRFVLKCSHDSGGLVICKDKKTLDVDAAKAKLTWAMQRKYYLHGREWPYKQVVPRILCEAFLGDEDGEPDNSQENGDIMDYKIMCFGGEAKCSFVCSERYSADGLKVTFFDRDWHVMPFIRYYPKSTKDIPKPKLYEKMIALSEKLSKGMPFARIDWYEVKGKLYFGEITLYPGNGFEPFTPVSADYELGSWIPLPAASDAHDKQQR
ncbi:MAG: glycosyl transferase [Clostridia bacterium]|nr:glycosyl transferase [Clostridia bacterium]